MKLYYCDTTAPRKACVAARYLGAPVEYIYVDLASGEQLLPAYRTINPNAKVPTLVDGDYVIWEANAIMCYLAYHEGSELWPTGDRQIDIIRWMNWDAEHFSRYAGTLYFERSIKARFAIGTPDEDAVAQALAGFRRYAPVLNTHLDEWRYLVGNGLTVADFAVAITLPYAAEIDLPLDEFPAIRRWHDRLEEIEAWRRPFPLHYKRFMPPTPKMQMAG